EADAQLGEGVVEEALAVADDPGFDEHVGRLVVEAGHDATSSTTQAMSVISHPRASASRFAVAGSTATAPRSRRAIPLWLPPATWASVRSECPRRRRSS